MKLDSINKKNKDNVTIEQVQQEKIIKKLGTYLVRNGLKIYAYNRTTNKIKEVIIKHGNYVELIVVGFKKYDYIDPERLKCEVDSKDIHFEALNYKTASLRVEKYLSGKIKELSNLRESKPKHLITSIYNGLQKTKTRNY